MGKELFTADSQLFAADSRSLSSVWYPCKSRPDIEGDTLRWALNYRKPFNAFDAYKAQAHRALINAGTDDALFSFVEEWGPLFNGMGRPEGEEAISDIRGYRDRLIAWAKIIDRPGTLDAMQSVCCLLRLDEGNGRWGVYTETAEIRAFLENRTCTYSDAEVSLPFDSEMEHRILNSVTSPRQEESREICRFMLNRFGVIFSPFAIILDGRHTRAVYRFYSLTDVLMWAMWHDLWTERPFHFCARRECRNIVIHEDARFKKFCSRECEKIVRDRRYAENLRRKRKRAGLTSRGTIPTRNVPKRRPRQ